MRHRRPSPTALSALLVLGLAAGRAQADDSTLLEWVELLAADGAAGDRFGEAVALSGDTAVIGAPYGDDPVANAGAAYVFERQAGGAAGWGRVAKLSASDAWSVDFFGAAVGIDGDRIVVGAWGDDDAGTYTGAAYVFERDAGGPGAWGQVAKLLAADAAEGERFGTAVAISGDTVLVGSARVLGSGSTYVFERDSGGAWQQVTKLLVPGYQAWPSYGLVLEGDTAVISNSRQGAGLVFVHERDQGGPDAWGQVALLTTGSSNLALGFGTGVSIAGDTIAVGVPGDSAAAIRAGTVHLYERDLGGADAWGLLVELRAPDAAEGDELGGSVAIAGGTVLAGAPRNDAVGPDAGAVYVFQRDAGGAGAWGWTAKLATTDAATQFYLGRDIALSGATALVGDALASDSGAQSGAAFVYLLGGPSVAFCFGDGAGTACPCSNPGAPGHGCSNGAAPAGCRLEARGNASVLADGVRLAVTGSIPAQVGVFFQGDQALAGGQGIVFGDGLRCAGGRVLRLETLAANGAGAATSTVAVAAAGGVQPGDVRYYQWWYRDPSAPPPCVAGYNLSNGLTLVWAP